MRKVVVAGGSQAGVSAVRELRKRGYDGEIVVTDSDPHVPYRRPEVSKGLLSGGLDQAGISLPSPAELDVRAVTGDLVGLDVRGRSIRVREGDAEQEVSFDGLVIATGVTARPAPFPVSLQGVHTLRTAADAGRMRADLERSRSLVIVGGGYIGLEVAAIARGLGKAVTVVEAGDVPLAGVLGRDFGEHVTRIHRGHGVNIRAGLTVDGLVGGADGRVTGVLVGDGSELEADIVLVATGSVPAVGWLAGSGLELSDGVVVDATCAVPGAEHVVAAGDVASWVNPLYDRRMRVEHWTNAMEQGAFAARRLLGQHDQLGFSSAPYVWTDQYDLRIQCLGSTVGHDQAEVLVRGEDRMLVAYGKGGRLVAVAGMHMGAAVMRYRAQLVRTTTMSEVLSP